MIADVPRNRGKEFKGRSVSPAAWLSPSPGYGQTTVALHMPTRSLVAEAGGASTLAPPEAPRWMTIKALAHLYRDVITESALRHLVWQAEAYAKHPKGMLKSNGFLQVIVRPPGQRKVLLDRSEFEKWLTSGNSGVSK